MMIPEAWENNAEMDQARRDFYAFHSCLMEPWDGPAGVVFTDGLSDRRDAGPQRAAPRSLLGHRRRPGRAGLRGRGARHRPVDKWSSKGRLQPGKMFLADLAEHRIISDDEIKSSLAAAAALRRVAAAAAGSGCSDLPEREHVVHSHASVTRRQQVFGYTEEDLRIILAPMATGGAEPIGSMGTDTPGRRAQRPAADAVRLLLPAVRPGHQPAAGRDPRGARHLAVQHHRPGVEPARARPGVLPPAGAAVPGARQRRPDQDPSRSTGTATCPATRPTWCAACTTCQRRRARRWRPSWTNCAPRSRRPSPTGARTIILSDRHSNAELAPIPSLLLTAAIHHHLVREKTRTKVGLVVEAGDVREVHHVALLIGYGAAGGQPVPGHRDRRGPGPTRRLSRTPSRRTRSRT